jgi:hypothetical protein
MKIICIGEKDNEVIYNVNHIVRVTKATEYGKPCIKLLTTTGSLDTLTYTDEADYLKNIAVLKQAMEEV